MKKIVLISLISLMACGGSLSDEQRKRLHEGMDHQKIVKMSDSEIVIAALDRGRVVYSLLEKISFDSLKVDSIALANGVRAVRMSINAANATGMEKQIIEAYISSAATGGMQDNVQKIRLAEQTDYDSLIYSKPIVTIMPDGAERVDGIWNIYLAKKQVILSAAKNY